MHNLCVVPLRRLSPSPLDKLKVNPTATTIHIPARRGVQEMRMKPAVGPDPLFSLRQGPLKWSVGSNFAMFILNTIIISLRPPHSSNMKQFQSAKLFRIQRGGRRGVGDCTTQRKYQYECVHSGICVWGKSQRWPGSSCSGAAGEEKAGQVRSIARTLGMTWRGPTAGQ